VGPFDASILSDGYARESDGGMPRAWGFTGAFFGLWVQDMTGAGRPADFSAATCKAAALRLRRLTAADSPAAAVALLSATMRDYFTFHSVDSATF
jgi:hypothetical protein